MKTSLLSLVCLLFIVTTTTLSAKPKSNNNNNIPTYSDEEYEQRIKNISYAFEFRYNQTVKDYIVAQTVRGKKTSERVLGKGQIFFPIFEQYMLKHQIPTQFKYLPMIESQLEPAALSPAGAGGFWQFMPETARMYGLTINKYVDERCDPYKSSEAAAILLSRLYTQYNSWAAALAAYNAGQVKVNNAIKATGSVDYWVFSNNLPRETQVYVPKFIAAAYVANYYYLHDLSPLSFDEEFLLTDTIHVYKATSFKDLSEQTSVSIETLRFLNPAFLLNFIPASKNGYVVTLPLRKAAEYKGFASTSSYAGNMLAQATYAGDEFAGVKLLHIVGKDDTVEGIARLHGVSPQQLMLWNNLRAGVPLTVGSKLAIKSEDNAAIKKGTIEQKIAKTFSLRTANVPFIPEHTAVTSDGTLYYEVQAGDNVWKISKLYPDVDVKSIIEMNGASKINRIQAGDMIKIMKINS
jgi:membrane-bound lytic murein transglycosylase D